MVFKKHVTFSIVLLILIIGYLLVEYYAVNSLLHFSKPLVIIALISYLISKTSVRGRFHKRILGGLFFAAIGDILLTFTTSLGEQYFNYGFICFMLCNVFFISAFYLDFKSAPELDKKGARFAIIICGILSTCFFFYLRPHLGLMRVPILAYTLIISLMVMMSAFRHLRVNQISFKLILAGAILFMLSDALFALNRFVWNAPYVGLLITGSYFIAQYLVTLGTVERELIHKN